MNIESFQVHWNPFDWHRLILGLGLSRWQLFRSMLPSFTEFYLVLPSFTEFFFLRPTTAPGADHPYGVVCFFFNFFYSTKKKFRYFRGKKIDFLPRLFPFYLSIAFHLAMRVAGGRGTAEGGAGGGWGKGSGWWGGAGGGGGWLGDGHR